MASTRSASSRLTRSGSKVPPPSPAGKKTAKSTESEDPEADGADEPKSTSSFNGRLERFGFKSTITKEVVGNGTLKRTASTVSSFSSTSSPTKKRRAPSRYAPPSKYAHLKPLTDIFEHNLIAIFVGTNPGIQTATAGHAYAHPSNSFWKMLHVSGLTDRRLRPEEDVTLPEKYQLGNTNIVSRPSKDAAELSKEEQAAGTPILEEKFAKWRPEAVCIVGKGIWESIWRWRHGRGFKKGEFEFGWQSASQNMGKCKGWKGARVYVTPSTSGLAASLRPHEKEALWKPFGEWVVQRRKEREEERAEGGGEEGGAEEGAEEGAKGGEESEESAKE